MSAPLSGGGDGTIMSSSGAVREFWAALILSSWAHFGESALA
jgi:hypothetical protein